MGTFMLLLDLTIVNVALPDIQAALHASFTPLQWIVDVYALTLAALLLTAGSLADLLGRKRVYLVGLTVFTVASALCGVAQDVLLLQVARALQGIGGATIFATSLALLAGAFHGKERGTAFGVWGAVTGLAVAVGPLLGGVLTSALSWRWIFFVNLPIGVAAVALTAAQVRESRAPSSRRPDWPGLVVFTTALTALVYGLIESGDRGFGDGSVIASLVAAALLLTVFVAIDARSSAPMFDLALFRKPTFTGGAVAAFGINGSVFAMLLFLVLYLQDVLGYDALQTGVRLLALSGAILVTATVAGRLSAHLPARALVGVGLLIVGTGLFLMRGIDASSSWTHLLPGLLVAGVGAGMVNPPLASTAVGVVAPHQAGMASGINSTFRQVGITTGIAVYGTVFTSALTDRITSGLASSPGLSGHADEIATATRSGGLGPVLQRLPTDQREHVAAVAKAAFTSGLDRILLVSAAVAVVAGVLALVLIRAQDFAAVRGAAH
nr:MFS transporter [Motilibacter rhizosphaerae]